MNGELVTIPEALAIATRDAAEHTGAAYEATIDELGRLLDMALDALDVVATAPSSRTTPTELAASYRIDRAMSNIVARSIRHQLGQVIPIEITA